MLIKIEANFNLLWVKRILTFFPMSEGYLREFYKTAMGGICLVQGITVFPNSPKIFFVLTDSTGEAGCNNWSIPYLFTQPFSLGNIDITSFFVYSGLPVNDSLINFSVNNLSLTDSVYCNTATDIENNPVNGNLFSVYPQITNNNLYIKCNHQVSKEKLSIIIYSIDGKVVHKNEVNCNNEIEINQVSVLKAGIYFLSVKISDKIYYFKFIKY